MKAKDVMTHHVVKVDEDTSVVEVARTLLKWRISAVPVVDANDRLVGIVSEGDLMRRPESDTDEPSPWLAALAAPEVQAAEYAKTHGRCAGDVMTKTVVTVDEDTSVSEIAQILEERHIKRVPVMRGAKLVGIVSRANLLHGLAVSELSAQPTGDDDARLRATILNRLRNDTGATLESINVIVSKGAAHLWGTALSEVQKDAVRIATEETPGVSSVEDHMTVLPEIFRQWMSSGEALS